MTKQEFAIKLLFWLMPWPLSKALPRILIRILDGPAAQTPLQWAQATYHVLTQYLSDATAYAQSLFETAAHITPTEQLTTAAAALTAAIENATSLLATLTEMLADLEAYTPEQISQAFSDAINAMDDLTSAMDALLDVIQEIQAQPPPEALAPEEIPPEEIPELPPEEIPVIPPPPTLPYIPPFPSPFAPMPGPGLYTPIYQPGNLKPKARWVAHFDNANWENDDTYLTETLWHPTGHFWYPDDSNCQMLAIGTWPTNYRPTKMRITWTGPDPTCYVRLSNISGDFVIGTDSSYISGEEITLDFTDALDLGMLNLTGIYTITNIEFYEE